MKRMKFFIFIIVFFMIVITNVRAEDYECYYSATIPKASFGTKDLEGSFKVIEAEKKLETGSFLGFPTSPVIIDKYVSDKYTEEKLIELLNGRCPKNVYVCEANQIIAPGGTGSTAIFVIINPSLIDELTTTNGLIIQKYNSITYSFKHDDCEVGNLEEEKSTGIKGDISFSCDRYNELYGEMKENYCTLKDSNCDSTRIEKYNQKKDELRNYCNAVLKRGDYINPCVENCLNISEDIGKIEGTVSGNENNCGFSDNLIIWIANIIRWVKYIVPVIVIVLGIIDFIRAVAADKDDEMKKAQGRFIKRLIAAALIFIVPFIIEFVLDKMGFTSNGCGIINL